MSFVQFRSFERLEDRRLFATVIGLTADNMLVQFDDNNPDIVSSASPIKNLAAGERVVAIDYRPANSRLYGVVDGDGTDRIIRLDRAGNSSLVFNLTTQLDGAEFVTGKNTLGALFQRAYLRAVTGKDDSRLDWLSFISR